MKKIFRKNGLPSLGRPMREFIDLPEATKVYSGDRLKELEKTFDSLKGECYLETILTTVIPAFH